MKALHLGLAVALVGGAAAAQAPKKSDGTVYIAPGNPATVGRGGSVRGVVPGETTPAPHGSMSTFGGKFGTEGPRTSRTPAARANPP